MQHGSMIRTERQRKPDVWEFRWREPSPDGRCKHRRMASVPLMNSLMNLQLGRRSLACGFISTLVMQG
jgi:hypothetical protein